MSENLTWPALHPGKPPTGPLAYQRAVWGKVHGAASDFRWIARSLGFRPGDRMARDLVLGSEDHAPPQRLYFWLPLSSDGKASGYVAGTAYPSRAVDADGRRGFLEKQLLDWANPKAQPAAAGALLLLPAMAQWTDDCWWQRVREQDWSLQESVLALGAKECAPFAPAAGETDPEGFLDAAIMRGLSALESIAPAALEHFYAALLGGDRPACLAGLAEPVPAEALSALLLPLERPLADRLSLAGWVPSHRYALEELGRHWDALVLPAPAEPPPLSARAQAKREEARLCVRALREKNPVCLKKQRKAGVAVGKFAESKPAANKLGYRLQDETWPILPGARLDLTPPGADAGPFLRLFHDFAATVDRRLLEPSWVKNNLRTLALSEAEARQVCLWVKELEQAPRPHYAESRQWELKIDLLRALVVLLAPASFVQEGVQMPRGENLLFYAPSLIETRAGFEKWKSCVGNRLVVQTDGKTIKERDAWIKGLK